MIYKNLEYKNLTLSYFNFIFRKLFPYSGQNFSSPSKILPQEHFNAGLDLGEDREYGTPDDRWLESSDARIGRVDIKASKDSEISDIVVSAGVFSLDEVWGNGDELGTFGRGRIERVSLTGNITGNNYFAAENSFWFQDRQYKVKSYVTETLPYSRAGVLAEVLPKSEEPPL